MGNLQLVSAAGGLGSGVLGNGSALVAQYLSIAAMAEQPAVRIEDIRGEAIANRAVEKCLRWKGPKRLEPGKYTVVPALSLRARAAEQGQSFLTKKGGGTLLGEKLFPEFVTLRSDPANRLYPARPWSVGSMPNVATTWIEKGVVKNLYWDRYWASKAGREATVNPGSLVLDGGERDLAAQIAAMERGLLVNHRIDA